MESLQNKHIGLIACPAPLEARVGSALEQVNACFAHIDANTVRPGAPELERYDALLLHVADGAAELDWFRPEILRLNTRPLLLADTALWITFLSRSGHVDITRKVKALLTTNRV